MENQKTIDVLNNLNEINNGRIHGYPNACDEAEESDLKNRYSQLSQASLEFHTEVIDEVEDLNETSTKGTKVLEEFFRAWMDVKVALTAWIVKLF